VRCFVVAGFLLTSASRGPSAIAEPLVFICSQTIESVSEIFSKMEEHFAKLMVKVQCPLLADGDKQSGMMSTIIMKGADEVKRAQVATQEPISAAWNVCTLCHVTV